MKKQMIQNRVDVLPNQWLSAFFGREIREIKISADESERTFQLQQHGFQFVEGELEFCLSLANFSPKMTACEQATIQDITELQALFGNAFPHSRFRAPWFSDVENQRFYQTWITNAVKGEFDDICFVQRTASGQIQGGISVRMQNNQAKIGLLAVAPLHRKQGIASQLLQTAITWARQQGAEKLWIATQSCNLPAINLYQKLGAQLIRSSYWFYK